MHIWHGAGAGRCCPESSSPAPGVQSDLTNVLMASPLKPKLKKRANKTCIPQHVFIIHVLQEWLGWDLLPRFSHSAFNGKASWLAMQCDPLRKTQQTQGKKKKIPNDVFMIQNTHSACNNALVSDVQDPQDSEWPLCHTRKLRLSKLLQEPCLSTC